MSRFAPYRLWFVLWLTLSLGLVWANRDLLCRPVYEEGDDAANALSIERAKHGTEMHGNYSRFGFHHPGPAFFYVYAAGEWILEDALRVAPARHNAHLLAGILLQAAFLAGLIALLAGYTEQPWCVAWLLLAVLAAHFAFVPHAFSSIWPPFVLMLPLAGLVVAAASLATGSHRGWLGLALAGGFLLHGHVAQPLVVFPLVAMAVAGRWWSTRQLHTGWTDRLLPPRPTRWVVGALVALFLLPLVLDLTAGRESNAARIVQHLIEADVRTRPTWSGAVGYTLSFFAYASDQDQWWGPNVTTSPAGWLGQHAVGAVLGLALAGVALVAVLRRWRTPTPTAQLIRRLAIGWLAGLLLALLWARRQDGGLLYFNSYYLFGLGALLPVFPILAWSAKLHRLPVWAPAVVAVGLLLGGAPRFRAEALIAGTNATAIADHLPDLLARDPWPAAPKLLQFDQEHWAPAVTLAAALQRAGVPFYVAPGWAFMFGEDHVLHHAPEAVQQGPLALWHIGAPGTEAADLPLTSTDRLTFPAPADLGPTACGAIDFTVENRHQPFVALGVGRTEAGFAWTESRLVWLRWQWHPSTTELELTLDATPLGRQPQRVEIWLNHQRLGEWRFDKNRAVQCLRLPPAVWAQGQSTGTADLRLHLPDAVAPATYSFTHWNERRILGLRLHRLQVAPAAP